LGWLSTARPQLVSFALRCVPAADASGASDGTRSALDASDASASLRLGAGGSTAEKVSAEPRARTDPGAASDGCRLRVPAC
jgi:hypothetical protein